MTSDKLKHQAQLQEWVAVIQTCRSSRLSVRKWCRQQEISPSTCYRWEREVLSAAGSMAQQEEGESVTFAEVPVLNTPPETVPLDRTNGAPRPLKWCMVTAAMVH